ncbi:MAG: hypothetical protein PHH70_04080 [Candidatus Gracilibacteria bacterium]|nr:hypothetical protein [Candidatus Gracilibacteria bacterium]
MQKSLQMQIWRDFFERLYKVHRSPFYMLREPCDWDKLSGIQMDSESSIEKVLIADIMGCGTGYRIGVFLQSRTRVQKKNSTCG